MHFQLKEMKIERNGFTAASSNCDLERANYQQLTKKVKYSEKK